MSERRSSLSSMPIGIDIYPDGVFLLDAAADWAGEFARLSARRQLDGGDPSAPGYRDKMAAAMAAHLRERPNALLIFDNVLDPADIRRRPIALGLLPIPFTCSNSKLHDSQRPRFIAAPDLPGCLATTEKSPGFCDPRRSIRRLLRCSGT